MIIIDALLEQFDLPQFMEDNGYDLKPGKGKTKYLTTCPWCGKEGHFGFDPDKKIFGCFKCHKSGRSFELIKKIYGKSYVDTLELLKDGVDKRFINIAFLDMKIKEFKEFESLESRIKPMDLPSGYEPLRNRRIEYLDKRQITQDQVHYYKMGLCTSGFYKNRLIVCDVNDYQEPIYWIARDVTGLQPKSKKVLNPTIKEGEIGSGDILFNFSLAKSYPVGIIVEGVFDALWTGNNAMATYGYCLKVNHLSWLLKANFTEMVLLYDSDVIQESLEDNALLLSQFFHTRICKLPYGDPDEWPKDKLWEMINNAPPFSGDRLHKLKCEITI